jgi:uncharacterized lipoprotein YmbA
LAAALLSLLLAACASSGPPPRLLRLPATPPQTQTQTLLSGTALSTGGTTGAWQLIGPIGLPNYLDSDAVLVAEGPAELRPLPGVRWAEPLRDAVPRLLTADLVRLRGEGKLWTGPVPAGQTVQRELRLTLTALDAQADGSVSLRARWTLLDPAGALPPISRETSLHTAAGAAAPTATGSPASTPDGTPASTADSTTTSTTTNPTTSPLAPAPLSADALAVAERLALWQLAQQVANAAAPGL